MRLTNALLTISSNVPIAESRYERPESGANSAHHDAAICTGPRTKPKKQFSPPKRRVCMYCGDWYECRDHVTPVCMSYVFRSYNPDDTVFCCHLCNQLAGSFPATSVQDKAFHLMNRYEFKFRKVLALPPWSEEEICEVRGYLKTKIHRNEKLRILIRQKLLNLDLVTLGYDP